MGPDRFNVFPPLIVPVKLSAPVVLKLPVNVAFPVTLSPPEISTPSLRSICLSVFILKIGSS